MWIYAVKGLEEHVMCKIWHLAPLELLLSLVLTQTKAISQIRQHLPINLHPLTDNRGSHSKKRSGQNNFRFHPHRKRNIVFERTVNKNLVQ
jgi:hypothetical protein